MFEDQDSSEQVDFCLEKEPADFDEMHKSLDAGIKDSCGVDLFTSIGMHALSGS